jgi:(1->4)-alpha-D-glucan 1-alpha-D-glucosylmutase
MNDTSRPIPRATYRLQLSSRFTFKDVSAIANYLGDLGVSHVYLSPILKARPGSTHGYDTVDHTLINPELGTIDDFRQMARELQTRGVGIILDIVPNHMGIGGDDNTQWLDVLRWGEKSPYAEWFDINWHPDEASLHHKVLVPMLGCSFGEALNSGAFKLKFDSEAGSFDIWLDGTHRLPLDPACYGQLVSASDCASLVTALMPFSHLPEADASAQARQLQDDLARSVRTNSALSNAIHKVLDYFNDAEAPSHLNQLISRQHWRPAHFSVAADDINYRRFFIVSDLAAIRIEREDVFDHVHRLVFSLVEEGWIEGLRVDHIDGLYDPKAYCLTLRRKCPRPIYLIVEKILAPHEMLPREWDVEGTTGYEFGAQVTRLLTDEAGEKGLSEFYQTFTGRTEPLDIVERAGKLSVIDNEMAAELDSLTAKLRGLAAARVETADITRAAIRRALRQVVSEMPVYRTYVDDNGSGGER